MNTMKIKLYCKNVGLGSITGAVVFIITAVAFLYGNGDTPQGDYSLAYAYTYLTTISLGLIVGSVIMNNQKLENTIFIIIGMLVPLLAGILCFDKINSFSDNNDIGKIGEDAILVAYFIFALFVFIGSTKYFSDTLDKLRKKYKKWKQK